MSGTHLNQSLFPYIGYKKCNKKFNSAYYQYILRSCIQLPASFLQVNLRYGKSCMIDSKLCDRKFIMTLSTHIDIGMYSS